MVAATSWRAAGWSSSPSNSRSIQLGIDGAAQRRELARLGDVGDGQDAGHDLGRDPRRRRAVAEAEEAFRREEELADRAGRRPASILRLQIVDDRTARLVESGWHSGISRDRNLERRDLLQPRHQIGGVAHSLAGAARTAAPASRHVAAKCYDVADARLPIFARDGIHLVAARLDAGQVRGGRDRGFAAMRATVACVRSRVEPPAP